MLCYQLPHLTTIGWATDTAERGKHSFKYFTHSKEVKFKI